MAASDAVRFQIADEILRILQKELTFNAAGADTGTVRSIKWSSIVLQKDSNTRGTFNLPAIVVSSPRHEDFPEDLGTNEHDEYRYRFLLQFLDSDNWQRQDNLRTYWRWQQDATLRFQYNNMLYSGNIFGTYFCMSNAAAVDTVDEKVWVKEASFRAGVLLVVRTWLTRTSKQ